MKNLWLVKVFVKLGKNQSQTRAPNGTPIEFHVEQIQWAWWHPQS